MAVRTMATILGPTSIRGGGRGVVVDVLVIDPALIGKVWHLADESVVDTTGFPTDVAAVQAQFPSAEVYASYEARRPQVEQMLIDAGLRTRDANQNLVLTARAQRIDAGLEGR